MKKTQQYEDDDEERAEYVARDFLDPLSEKILMVLHMMIKYNQSNSEKITKYDNIIFIMLMRYDTKIVGKIFKEAFKRA